jgi:hypothetical protein
VDLRFRLTLAAALALAAPAVLCAAAGALHQVTGWPVTRPFEAVFAALGVTASSPLPLRQAWYLGAFILGPLAGAALASTGAFSGAKPRAAFLSVASGGTLIAIFWVLQSLLDD